jgi:hypothetical protein
VGTRLAAARGALAARELMIDPVVGDTAPYASDAGRVYRQYPEPSLEVPQGVAVRVWVYGEPPRRATPVVADEPTYTPRTYDTPPLEPQYEPEEEPADPWAGTADLLQQMLRDKQRGDAGRTPTRPCQYTGNPITDAVLRGAVGDCDAGQTGGSRSGGGGSGLGDVCCEDGFEPLFGVGCMDGSEPRHACAAPPAGVPPSGSRDVGPQRASCLVDSQVSRSSGNAPFFVQQNNSAGISGFKIMQTEAPRGGMPAGISMHGPYRTLSAAQAALDRLCPPSQRSTGSIRFR